ncbi:hypothetical protein ASZ78_014809 [Callipepla squamata]|uniref:Uncharacterized protein n=1 Tax=Callipepla squamata TaxID=9009 RepID=A0A226N6E2_CALSU|nr:hypothetical protein ASZ78_014809 [Callipepla squamata]
MNRRLMLKFENLIHFHGACRQLHTLSCRRICRAQWKPAQTSTCPTRSVHPYPQCWQKDKLFRIASSPCRYLSAKEEKKKGRRKLPVTRGEVEIRQQMTVEELARGMGKDIGESFSVNIYNYIVEGETLHLGLLKLDPYHIYEALLYTDIDVDSLEPDSILYEDSIKLIVKKSGMKYKSAKLKEEKERENKDAVKRILPCLQTTCRPGIPNSTAPSCYYNGPR